MYFDMYGILQNCIPSYTIYAAIHGHVACINESCDMYKLVISESCHTHK